MRACAVLCTNSRSSEQKHPYRPQWQRSSQVILFEHGSFFHIQNDFSGAETAFHPRWLPVAASQTSDLRKLGASLGAYKHQNYVLAAPGDLKTTGFDEIKQ
jgi:hypothetical protein